MTSFLAVADGRQIQVGRTREQVAVGVDEITDPDQMVVDVAEIGLSMDDRR
jgi:hypothetical protein